MTTTSQTTASARACIDAWLDARLDGPAKAWLADAREEIANGAEAARFCTLISMASRHARRQPLAPGPEERAAASAAHAGWEPERWTVQETMRVALVLARPDLAEDSAVAAIEEAFRYADEGELCALYRSLAHLPEPTRFAWRAKEGCRTNMVTVFEANVLDTPFPREVFDDVAWNQAVIKSVFIGAPLWRLFGLDERLSPECARMALDLVEERRSAGREVQHELWLAVGAHGGERGLAAIRAELDPKNPHALGRAAAAIALARAGAMDELSTWLEREPAGAVQDAMRAALDGDHTQAAFRALDPR